MSTITSGIGLISGLPTAQIIDSLMAIQARPRALLQNRITGLQSQRTALLELSARLTGLKATAARLGKSSFFNQYAANSSNENVLQATASEGATPGVINFTVKSLVTNHQLISTGFADGNATPVGAGQINIEIGNGRLNPSTRLGDLNGGAGVRRGRIEITDRAGKSAVIDVTAVVTLDEVLRAINTHSDINVKARVSGNRIVLEDLNTTATGLLSVNELEGGFTAADLGLSGSVAGPALQGSDILYLSDSTLLTQLNDRNGVRAARAGDDFQVTSGDGAVTFAVGLRGDLKDSTRLEVLNNGNGVRLGEVRITNRAGQSATVDLSTAATIGDVKALIAGAVDDAGESLNIVVSTVTTSGVGSLIITDNSVIPPPAEGEEAEETPDEEPADEAAAGPELIVEDVTGYAARDLGIARTSTTNSFVGNGIHRITTIGDVIRAINFAEGNADGGPITASLTPNGIQITDSSGGATVIQALGTTGGALSKAALDLGFELDETGRFEFGGAFESRHLIAGLNTVLLGSLNGGSGVSAGSINVTARNGVTTNIDLSAARTVQDVLDAINATTPTSGVTATISTVGSGIAIQDVTGATTSNLIVAENGGTTAAELGILGSVAGKMLDGGNAQLRYISEATQLATLNGGRGVRPGDFEIRSSSGAGIVVNISSGTRSLGDVINQINSAGQDVGISAQINATGDGLLIVDANGGTQPLTIRDINGGQAAKDLRVAGEADEGAFEINGSFEIRIEINADDTLQDVARKIREASSDLDASVINDGASSSSFRLSVSSKVTGSRGELIFDGRSLNLNMNTLVAPRDAVVLIGGADSPSPIVVSSPTNSLSGVVPGVEIDLVGASDETVTLSIGRDMERLTTDLAGFVTNYNAIVDRIDQLTSFNPDTQERGILLGDSTISFVESRLARAVIGRFDVGQSAATTLASVGITFGDGGRLSFDEERFREKFIDDPAAIEQLFTADETGVGAVLESTLEFLTNETDGLMTRRSDLLNDQVEDLNDRIASMDLLLAARRDQLERQFASLETVLAGLQDQQNALVQLAQMAQRASA